MRKYGAIFGRLKRAELIEIENKNESEGWTGDGYVPCVECRIWFNSIRESDLHFDLVHLPLMPSPNQMRGVKGLTFVSFPSPEASQ